MCCGCASGQVSSYLQELFVATGLHDLVSVTCFMDMRQSGGSWWHDLPIPWVRL